jgi:CheY-like chemotaxis protein
MGAPLILVVDDDEWIIAAVRVALQPRKYEIVGAGDGWEGLTLATRRTPDVVISDIVMPNLDGWAFVKQLRSKADLALVPVIFLTTQDTAEDFLRGYRLGADDYLPKPVDTKELDLRVVRALKQRETLKNSPPSKPPAPGSPPGSLRGTVDQMGLASLLSILQLGRRSGILQMRRSSGEEGMLFLVDGAIHRAETRGGVKRKNHEAVYALLGWAEGTYEFSTATLRTPDEIAMPTESLLLEGARRLDEAKR